MYIFSLELWSKKVFLCLKSNEKNCVFLFRLAQKVSELLDTFKPGTFSYRPFKKPMRSIAVIDANNNR